MKPMNSGRIVRTYTQRIEASPDRVFPLLCPVREAEWLDEWADAAEMIHTASGVAEDGCVFRTRHPGGVETIWMITHHDPAARVVEFTRVTPGLAATRLRIDVDPLDVDTSAVRVAYTVTPLGPEGAKFVADHFRDYRFRDDMRWWEDSMNHWLHHGTCLRVAEQGA